MSVFKRAHGFSLEALPKRDVALIQHLESLIDDPC
jgi:hypothetical protein